MNIDASFYSALGKRENNEDAVSLVPVDCGILAVVADGLGGHCNGEVASHQAVETLNKQLNNTAPDEGTLIDAIQEASQIIHTKQIPGSPMHTTIAALWIYNDLAIAANVGDTRIYQFRNGKIIFQSLDHSVAQMAVLVGQISAKDIRSSKNRNRLIRVLGTAEEPKVDCVTLSVEPGDRFLICSDGFWEPISEAQMQQMILESLSAEEWLGLMRQAVDSAGDPLQDNHSAIVCIIN